MKQQVNFYTQLAPPRASPKAFRGIAVACSVAVLGYLMTAGYLFNDAQSLGAAVAQAELNNNRLKIEINRRQEIDRGIDLKSLEQKLAQLTQKKSRLEVLISSLQDPTLSKMNGFSEAMTGLARQHVNGIALQTFEITHRGRQFSMAGQLRNPTALPTYITKLGSEAAFDNMSFERINIFEIDGELDFEVTSLGLAGEGS